MKHLMDLLVFSAEVTLIVLAIVILMAAFFYFRGQNKRSAKTVEIEHLNERLRTTSRLLRAQLQPRKEFKAELKAERKKHKADKLQNPKIFVLDFMGDMRA